MKRSAYASIERGAVLREVRSGPPLTLRRVTSENPEVCRMCVVNSAAGPLAGDDIALHLVLRAEAQAELTAAGATIAQGRSATEPGRVSSMVQLGENARLLAEPAPMIVCQGARVEVTINIELAETSTVHWQETLVLGRSHEAGGSAFTRWNLTRAGRPILRSALDLSDPSLATWPGMLSGHRVMMTTLVSEPGLRPASVVLNPTAVLQRIDDQTSLATVLDDDAANALRRMTELRAAGYRAAGCRTSV